MFILSLLIIIIILVCILNKIDKYRYKKVCEYYYKSCEEARKLRERNFGNILIDVWFPEFHKWFEFYKYFNWYYKLTHKQIHQICVNISKMLNIVPLMSPNTLLNTLVDVNPLEKHNDNIYFINMNYKNKKEE
jgi:hypothetical protein